MRKLTVDDLKERLSVHGITLLDEKVENIQAKVNVLFPCGHQGFANLNSLCRGRSPCRKCSKHKVLSVDEHRKNLKSLGITLISDRIDSARDYVTVAYECGHESTKRLDHAYNKVGCPTCKESSGARQVAVALKKLNMDFIREWPPAGCVYKAQLYFDFLIPEQKILIEYHGRQHYGPVSVFGGSAMFEEAKIRDRIKEQWAMGNGYTFIDIPFWVGDIEHFLWKRISSQR